MLLASIDIGTNTVLLTVADWDGKNIRVLRDEARITRLGEGLHRRSSFSPQAQERTLSVLKDYRRIADGAEKILAVGTASFRKAENAPDFVDLVLKETGITIRIISGEEEARLSYLSAAHDFGDSDDLTVLDIGGGSTEIISKAGGVSLNLGTVVLTESIVKHDPPTEEEVKDMEKEIDRVVGAQFIAPEKRGSINRTPTLIALAGSVTTLSAIKQKLAVWDGAKVQGSVLTQEDLDAMIALFRRTTNEEKSRIPGMVKGREDTILAGTLIVRRVLERLGVSRLTVSDRGLRFGLIYESINQDS